MEENKDLNIENNDVDKEDFAEVKKAVDKEDFANVNYENEEAPEEGEKPEKEKKLGKKGTIIGVAIAAVAVLVIVLSLTGVFKKKAEVGLTNGYNYAIGVPDGDYLYHSNISGTEFIKTNMATGETEVLSEAAVAFFAKHKGDIYYYDSFSEIIYKLNEGGDDIPIYQGSAYYHQYVGNYIYFLEPQNNAGGIVKRVSLKNGEAEVVLNVLCSSFTITDNNIIYFDPAIGNLLINKVKTAMNEAGELKTSAAIGSIVLSEEYAMNINVVGKNIYYTDPTKQYLLRKLDVSTGEIEGINFDTLGAQVNVFGDYLFYISPLDKNIYRTNLDGSDIRNLTEGAFQEVNGIALYKDRVVFYAIMGSYDETMQMVAEPYIVVMDFDGELICCFNPESNGVGAVVPDESVITE